jgi:uncharacterized membrane protein YhiD involved in acid resistance
MQLPQPSIVALAESSSALGVDAKAGCSEVALFWRFFVLVLVLVLNEMVLVLDSVPSSTSTANAEYEYEKPGDNADCLLPASSQALCNRLKIVSHHPFVGIGSRSGCSQCIGVQFRTDL